MTAAAPCRDAIATCFQCGRANPAHVLDGIVEGESRHFCCAGCRAIAQTIGAAGLGQFYTRREAPDAPFAEEPAAGDEPSRLAAAADSAGLIEEHARGERSVSLLLEGIHCAACTWLIESYLGRQPGVREVNVNFAARRARVRWDGGRVSLDALLRAIGSVGYRAYPYDRAPRDRRTPRAPHAAATRGHRAAGDDAGHDVRDSRVSQRRRRRACARDPSVLGKPDHDAAGGDLFGSAFFPERMA